MTISYSGVALIGNTTRTIKDVHGFETTAELEEYLDILKEEFNIQVFDIESGGIEAIGYSLEREVTLTLSSVHDTLKLAKKFEQGTGVSAKLISCIDSW